LEKCELALGQGQPKEKPERAELEKQAEQKDEEKKRGKASDRSRS